MKLNPSLMQIYDATHVSLALAADLPAQVLSCLYTDA